MSTAGRSVTDGLRDALDHAQCTTVHVDYHATEKTGEHEFTVRCSKCGRSWVEEDRGTWHRPIKVVRPSR